MRIHEVDVTNLIPVKQLECHITTLECRTNTKGSRWIIKTVVGDLVELEKYKESEKK